MEVASKPVAWSYSRLSSYELCPKKYHEESILRNYPFVKNEQAIYGEYVHEKFQKFLSLGEPLPLDLKHWTTVMTLLRDAPGEKQIEHQIALDTDWNPVPWYSKDAWLRVRGDFNQINPPKAIAWDFKTGNPRDDFTQLKLSAAVMFYLDDRIEEIALCFLWTKTKSVSRETMTRDDAVEFWGPMLARVLKFQEAHDRSEFPARPGWVCRFCPVKTCSFHP
jgi:CRISPR/Cas system-associated exonuclease Cas4 (RecB family)